MLKDSMTLYKLMILYMLNLVNFPLSNSQISEFFLTKAYTNYSDLQKALSSLADTKLIDMENTHNSSRYTINSEGIQTLSFFGKDIPKDIIEDINSYLKENKFKLRNESSSSALYYQNENNDYIVHFDVREGKDILINLDLLVPNKEQAIKMADNWKEKSSQIYQLIMVKLLSNKE